MWISQACDHHALPGGPSATIEGDLSELTGGMRGGHVPLERRVWVARWCTRHTRARVCTLDPRNSSCILYNPYCHSTVCILADFVFCPGKPCAALNPTPEIPRQVLSQSQRLGGGLPGEGAKASFLPTSSGPIHVRRHPVACRMCHIMLPRSRWGRTEASVGYSFYV